MFLLCFFVLCQLIFLDPLMEDYFLSPSKMLTRQMNNPDTVSLLDKSCNLLKLITDKKTRSTEAEYP